MLKIYNSLTKQKEEFKPLVPGKVGFYACGVTVYDLCHIGHARTYVVFDVVTKYLRASGYEVNYVRNITDIDDKIITRANENGESIKTLSERFTDAMHEDFARLDIAMPDSEPKATRHMTQIINMIQTLIEKEYAYVGSNGDVYYKVAKFVGYGKLSHKDIDGLRAGSRVEIAASKHDPLDFVLWKLAKENEPCWDSPWGKGRPGWHIECSAMSTHCLGNHFDIHAGGFDLQFPHHENEIAQAEAATDEQFVTTWMHSGLVQVDKEKMSKSLGNFFTIREVLEVYPAEPVRFFMISSHYRSPVNYSQESLNLAQASLHSLYNAMRGFDLTQTHEKITNEYLEKFNAAMNDDFNSPEAIAVLFEIAHEINRLRDTDMNKAHKLAQQIKQLGKILGVLQQDPEKVLHGEVDTKTKEKIQKLIVARNEARESKDWARADTIRKELSDMQVTLEDGAEGTTWRLG